MIDFIGKKYYFFAFSAILILVGVVSFFMHGGFNLDIQFQGGTVIEMQMNDNTFDTIKAEQIATDIVGHKVTAQKSYTINAKDKTQKMDMLTLSVSGNEGLSSDVQGKVISAIRDEFKVKPEIQQISVQNIRPSIGTELRNKGIMAIIIASLLIILYIWARFKVMSGLPAGVTAIVALVHDIAIMLSVYTVFNIPLNESFIAAVLTVLGYSMNDTIIIYDRIRENSSLLRRISVSELVNKSIWQTLARSIYTVLTVLICLFVLYGFAAYNNISSIKEFTFPLLIGISTGCYSSIFIASPLWVMWKESQTKNKVKAA